MEQPLAAAGRVPGEEEEPTVPIGTPYGEFQLRGIEAPSGRIYLAIVRGEVGPGDGLLVRLHSECLTGDVLGSLRCDCGPQLDFALRRVAAEGRGLVLYAIGDEGRGVGILNKLRAYELQDLGLDTIDANRHLGLPADARDFTEAGSVLRQLGVRSVRLLTNNPAKVDALRAADVGIETVEPLPTSPNIRSVTYLQTKRSRLGHEPFGHVPGEPLSPALDVREFLGRPNGHRPYVVLKHAQTIDGRTATATGDSRWISGPEERALSHALRSACDAVAVGIGTVLIDDPQLTVRSVSGPSPIRVVFDSRLRIPDAARVLEDGPATVVVTTSRSSAARRGALVERGIGVEVVPEAPGGVSLPDALSALASRGITTILVEGGASLATSLLADGLVHRAIVSIAPTVLGEGTNAIGDLGVDRISQAIHLERSLARMVGRDVVLAGDVEPIES
jgi:3,4-dihydroxy 2-butanone 4-phosphate synthase/GTP cyclohydrolase II